METKRGEMYFKEKNSNKGEILKHLAQTGVIEYDEPAFFHGRLYKTAPPAPMITWKCPDAPRHDHDAPDWLTASEYNDTPAVFGDKIERLAALLRQSRKTVIYTGAGISVSAGVGQAARGGSKGQSGLSTDAQPTPTHLALASLKEAGLVQMWIQQNHDGLPQKAGYPQVDIVEIHGSWYDPSNPVVCYDGALRTDLYEKMKEATDTADLVIVLGTSLSGLNSDRVARHPAKRSLRGNALGTVIINLQQTQVDGEATLRIFAETNRVFEVLLNMMKMPLESCPIYVPDNRVLVPYSKTGKRTDKSMMWLDLSKGQKIRLNPEHNCQKARQPVYMHIGAKEPHSYRGQVRQPGPGEGHVIRYSPKQGGWELQIEGVSMLLGGWWLAAAVRGQMETIPVINIDPIQQSNDGEILGNSRFKQTLNKQNISKTTSGSVTLDKSGVPRAYGRMTSTSTNSIKSSGSVASSNNSN